MLDYDRLAEVVLAGTKALMAKELAPLRAENEALRKENAGLVGRLTALEAREAPEPFDPSEIIDMIKAIDIPEIPLAPELPDIEGMIKTAVAAIPPAKDGKDGKDADTAILEAVRKDIDAVAARVESIRIPEAIPGKDGRGVAEVKQNADGELIVKYTTGETENAGRVRGLDGQDGQGFDTLEFSHDGERTATLSIGLGDQKKTFQFETPALIYRGVWSDGEYKKGDAVTWGGSLFIAEESTKEKPGIGKGWRLAVKKGRDANPQVKP